MYVHFFSKNPQFSGITFEPKLALSNLNEIQKLPDKLIQ